MNSTKGRCRALVLCFSCGYGSRFSVPLLRPLGRWQTLVGVPKFLRWGHAEALSESLRHSLPWDQNRAYSGVRFIKAEAVGTTFRRPRRVLLWLVRLLDLFQQRL